MMSKFFSILTLLIICLSCSIQEKSIIKHTSIVDSLFNNENEYFYGRLNCLNIINNHVYLNDSNTQKFHVYDADSLTFLRSFGEAGKGPNEYNIARSIVSKDSLIMICDVGNKRIQKLDYNENLQYSIPAFLIWNMKNIRNEIYCSNIGFYPKASIFKFSDEDTFDAYFNVSNIFDKFKIDKKNRPFTYFITSNNNIIIALETLGRLLLISEDKQKELHFPFCDREEVFIGEIHAYQKGFMIATMIINKDEIPESNFLYYDNNGALQKIFTIPKNIVVPDLFAWKIYNNFLFVYDNMQSQLYKLKFDK